MKGIHRVIVENKRIRYDFEIKRNITVIRSASAIELNCDKQCTVLDGRTWVGQLSMIPENMEP